MEPQLVIEIKLIKHLCFMLQEKVILKSQKFYQKMVVKSHNKIIINKQLCIMLKNLKKNKFKVFFKKFVKIIMRKKYKEESQSKKKNKMKKNNKNQIKLKLLINQSLLMIIQKVKIVMILILKNFKKVFQKFQNYYLIQILLLKIWKLNQKMKIGKLLLIKLLLIYGKLKMLISFIHQLMLSNLIFLNIQKLLNNLWTLELLKKKFLVIYMIIHNNLLMMLILFLIIVFCLIKLKICLDKLL